MSDKPTSKARFWETLQQKGPTHKMSPELDPRAGLSDLAEQILEMLNNVQAATVFELQTRLGVDDEKHIVNAARELAKRKLVELSTREKDTVVSLLRG
jgi:hypothetical protein